MKKCFLQFVFLCTIIPLIAQQKIASIDPGKTFSTQDRSIAYYSSYEHRFRITLQNDEIFTRLSYDTNFNLTDSFSFRSTAITFNNAQPGKFYFLAGIMLESGSYEAYANGEKVFFRQTDFKERKDKTIYEYRVRQTEKDERLLAVFPGKTDIKILSASFDKNRLFLYSWSPEGNLVNTSFDLPESNITDEKQKKEIPKEARIKLRNNLTHLSVLPLKQTTLLGHGGTAMYYSDDLLYILSPTPYNLGLYLITLDLKAKELKATNYFVNDLRDNASDNINYHKYVTGIVYDTLLIMKNASDHVYEYYFYDVKTGRQLRKYSTPPYELTDLIHSHMKQQGSWASATEKKEIDKYKTFLRKAGTGGLLAAAASGDSLTVTNIAIQQTTGIAGTLLDVLVPLRLNLMGVPSSITSTMGPLGIYRNKIIYAHSRFSIKDLALSKSSGVTTILDKLMEERNAEISSGTSYFLIPKDNAWYWGCYSNQSKKIEVFKYDGDQ